MFMLLVTWVKGLSVAGKVGLGILGFSIAGAVVVPSSSTPPSVDQEAKAEAKDDITTETVKETLPIAFTKRSVSTDTLDRGVTEVTTPGVKGVRNVTYKITKVNGLQIKKEEIASETTIESVEEITSIGTYVAPLLNEPRDSCDPNYSSCVPLVSYDLDCSDIGFNVAVLGTDPHGFDRDNDGYGCESY